MKNVQKSLSILMFGVFLALGTEAQTTSRLNGSAPSATALTPAEKKLFTDVETAAKGYVAVRERVRKQLPKLPDKATSEQIATNKTALRQGVQMTWANAKPGDVFAPAAGVLIKNVIKAEFQGWERSELRKTVLEADTKGVPLKLNIPYPESKELVEMSPALLLALPQLPKELRYRFIGRNLVILDRDNALIVDYLKDALP